MPFIAGGFFNLRNKQLANSINKSEVKPDYATAIKGLEEEKKTHIASVTDFQSEQIKDKVPKAKSLSGSCNQNETCELQSVGKLETFSDADHTKEFIWKITDFFQLPVEEGYYIDSEKFSIANAIWCLRMYPNGKKGDTSGSICLYLVRKKSYNSKHRIYYRFGFKTNCDKKGGSLIHAFTYHADDEEMGFVNLIERSNVSKLRKKPVINYMTVFCGICMIDEVTIPLIDLTSGIELLGTSIKTEELCLESSLSDPEIYIWKINNFSDIPVKEGTFIESAEFSVANATWCMRMYLYGQGEQSKEWMQFFLVRVHSSNRAHRIQFRLGIKKLNKKELGTLIHSATYLTNGAEMGVINLSKRSDIIRDRRLFLKNGTLTVFCHLYMVNEYRDDISNNTEKQGEQSSKISLAKKLNSSVGVLEKVPFLGAKDVIWKIPSFVIEPMQVGHWMDSPVFSFLNENWCLRFYLKEKEIDKDWKIYMYLVRFNTCSVMYLITYQLSILDRSGTWLKFKKRKCRGIYQSHVMKLGVSKLYFPPDGFVALYFQILSKEEHAKASMLTHKPIHHLEFPLSDVELYGPSLFHHGMLFERPVLAAVEIMWKIPDFFQLTEALVYSINSPVFEFGSDTWVLRLHPNGTEKTPGRISFILSRLYTSVNEQHIICYFSLRNSVNTISICKLEEVFEGSSESLPVHLELSEIVNKSGAIVQDNILTVFCQIYIMRENGDTEYLEPMTKDPLNVMNQFQYGFLFQQSFSAVTDITWKIPNFRAYEKDYSYVYSPVFYLANDTWLLQIYPNGYETSADKISLVLVRLFPSDVSHHIVCSFSVKNTNNVVSCENTFKDEILKSFPVHFKKFKSMKEQNDDPNNFLTVFCQMYVIEDKKAVRPTPSESMLSKEITVLPLDDMKQYIHGTLVQHLFLSATEVIWKIPDFFSLIKKQYEFVNSPVFGLANDTWLLRLYLKGNEISMRKIYCVLVRSFQSNLECHVMWKISIKNKKNMVIESSTCESTFRKKVTKSCPIYLEPSKIMDNVRENLPQDILVLFCQIYIIDDNRETVIKASSHIKPAKSMTNENQCVGDTVIQKENESKTNISEQFQNNLQDFTSKGEENFLENGKDIHELNSILLKEKKKKNALVNQIEPKPTVMERKGRGNSAEVINNISHKIRSIACLIRINITAFVLIYSVDAKSTTYENSKHLTLKSSCIPVITDDNLCTGDMMFSKDNKKQSNFSKGIQNSSQGLISGNEGNSVENEKYIDRYCDELDYTRLKKKKKKNAVMDDLEVELHIPEKKNEGNIEKNGDLRIGDVVFSKDNKYKSHFSKGIQNNTQGLISGRKLEEGNAVENEKDIDKYWDELDFTRLKKKKKKKTVLTHELEVEHHISEQKNEGNIVRRNAVANERDIDKYWDELDFTCLKKKKKKNVVMDNLEVEHHFPKQKNEGNIVRNDNMCTGDMAFSKDNENKSHFSKGIQHNPQSLVSGEQGNAVSNGKDIDKYWDELNFTCLKKKKKKKNVVMDNLEWEHHIAKQENEGDIVGNDDICKGDMAFSKDNKSKSHFSKGVQHNTECLVSGEERNTFENEKEIDELSITCLKKKKKKKNAIRDQLEAERPNTEKNKGRKRVKISDKSHQDSEVVPPCEEDFVKFLVRSEEILANFSAFKDQSTVFESIIQHKLMEASSMVIIEDCDPQIFKSFLMYLYTGQVDVLTSENVYGLYTVASKYGIHKLKIECLEYMKNTISLDTVCDIMVFSFHQKENEILELATAFFFENETEITSTAKWQMFLKENTYANRLLESVLKKDAQTMIHRAFKSGLPCSKMKQYQINKVIKESYAIRSGEKTISSS